MATARAYPLQWPKGWPKTDVVKRESGTRFKNVTLHGALTGLHDEVRRLGGKNLILSSNYTLGATNPKDCGVVAYFEFETKQVAIPCDRWNRIEANVRAIALTIEAMRGMERWGAKNMITAMFTGFVALNEKTEDSCWDVLGIDEAKATEEDILIAWRRQVKKFHPDNPTTGDRDKFEQVDRAKDTALQLVKQR